MEEVTWDERRITSVDWKTYNSLHLDYEIPTIESVFVTPAGVPATGAGETAITVTLAAIGHSPDLRRNGCSSARSSFHSRARQSCLASGCTIFQHLRGLIQLSLRVRIWRHSS